MASGRELPAVFRGIIKGIRDRGPGGVLYVHEDRYAYMFPGEFSHAEFGESLAAVVSATPGCFFVVENRDAALHVLAYPCERVQREAAEAAGMSVVEVAPPDA